MCNTRRNKKDRRIKVATWNIQGGLQRKLDHVTTTMILFGLDAVVLTETKAQFESEPTEAWCIDDITGNQFTIVRGKQVAIVLKGNQTSSITWRAGGDGRILTVNGSIGEVGNEETVNLIGCYFPPAIPRYEHLQQVLYQDLKTHIPTASERRTIITGDFNARIGYPASQIINSTSVGEYRSSSVNGNSSFFLEFIEDTNLCIPSTFRRLQFRNVWTWIHRSSGNRYQQDHFVVPRGLLPNITQVKAVGKVGKLSDHRMVIMTMLPKRTNNRHHPPRTVNNDIHRDTAAQPRVQQRIEELMQALPTQMEEAGASTAEIYDDLIANITQCTRLAVNSLANARNPERSNEQQVARSEIRAARKTLQKLRKSRNRNEQMRLLLRKLTRLKRRDDRRQLAYVSREILMAQRAQDPRAVYQGIRQLQRLAGKRISKRQWTIPIDVDGRQVTGEEVTTAHANRLAELYKRDPDATLPAYRSENNSLAVTLPTYAPTREEIESAVKQLRKGRRGGLDGIPPETMRLPAVQRRIHVIFTRIWNEAQAPKGMAESGFAMILKPHKPRKSIQSYRPVAMQSVIQRLFEKIMNERMRPWYENNSKEHQVAFKRHHQAIEHPTLLRLLAENSRRDRKEMSTLYIDLEKAYDSVHHDLLLQALQRRQLPTKYLAIISSMLQLASGRVIGRGRDRNSRVISVDRGLPQGGCLSPCLWNVFLDSVIEETEHELCTTSPGIVNQTEVPWLLAYADDITLVSRTTRDLQEALVALQRNLTRFGIKISEEKCAWTQMASTKMTTTDNTRLTLTNGAPIAYSPTFKYLGVQLNEKTHDMEIVTSRVRLATRANYSLAYFLQSKVYSVKLRYRVLQACIWANVLYGIEACSLSRQASDKLNSFQKRSIRNMLQADPNAELEELMDRVGETMYLSQYARLRRANFFSHIARHDNGPLHDLMIPILSSNTDDLPKRSIMYDVLQDLRGAVLMSPLPPGSAPLDLVLLRKEQREACAKAIASKGACSFPRRIEIPGGNEIL